MRPDIARYPCDPKNRYSNIDDTTVRKWRISREFWNIAAQSTPLMSPHATKKSRAATIR